MLIYLYLFSLIVGGVLLGASILLGGKDVDADGDADAGDLDGDGGSADADAEYGHGADGADTGHELGHGQTDAGDVHAGRGGRDLFLWMFRSIRFWTFFLAFFGMTGLALDGLGLAGPILALLSAVSMGTISGVGALTVIRYLARDQSARLPSSGDYVGKSVKVMVPVHREGVGKVRVMLKGNTVDVLATTDEEAPFSAKEEALIIEMDGGRARIARLNTKGE